MAPTRAVAVGPWARRITGPRLGSPIAAARYPLVGGT
jgi:hypothetical protein